MRSPISLRPMAARYHLISSLPSPQAAQAAEAIGLTDETSTPSGTIAPGQGGFDKNELVEESRRVLAEAREGLSHAFGGAGTDKARGAYFS